MSTTTATRSCIRGDLCIPAIDRTWPISVLVVRYLTACADRSLSQHSIKAYRIDLTQFITCSVTKNIPTRQDLAAYKALIFPLSPASRKRKLMSLSAFCTWLEESEIVASQIYKKSDFRVRLPQRLPRNLTKSTVENLLSSLRENSKGLLIVRLLLFTGVRVAEFCSLRVCDFDPASATFRINGKGNKQRTVPLDDKSTLGRLATHLRKRGEDHTGAMFLNRNGDPITPQNIRSLLRKYAPGVTPHMLRHTCATLYCEAGMNVRHVQKILGHSSIAITERYMSVSEGSLVSAIKSHPLNITAAHHEITVPCAHTPAAISELYGNGRYRAYLTSRGVDDPDLVLQEAAIKLLRFPPPDNISVEAVCFQQIKNSAADWRRRERRQKRGRDRTVTFGDMTEKQKRKFE